MSKQFYRNLVILLCGLCSTFVASAKDVFDDVKNKPGVDVVHVNRFMMSIVRSAVKLSADKDAKQALDVIDGIKSMDIIDCGYKKTIPEVHNCVQNFIKSNGYEVAMESKEDNETAIIYCLPSKNKSEAGVLKNVIIEVYEPGDYSVIRINGSINLETFTTSALSSIVL